MRLFHVVLLAFVAGPASAAETLHLSGKLAEGDPAFELVDFDVPDGVVEIEVRHTDDSAKNVVDFGLLGPDGFRGWGGGNAEPAVVGEKSASRSYLPGPMKGKWQAVLGKALVVETPARWSIEVVFEGDGVAAGGFGSREVPGGGGAVKESSRAGTRATFTFTRMKAATRARSSTEVADFARSRGLDFVALSDHNTVSQLDFIDAAQARHPELLFVPSVEFTTYSGHANGLGATRYVSHLMGVDTDINQAVDAFLDQGAVFCINHPVLKLGDACLGCHGSTKSTRSASAPSKSRPGAGTSGPSVFRGRDCVLGCVA